MSVDHVISDPPYDERTHQDGRKGHSKRKISKRAPKSFDPIDPADVAPWLIGLTRRWVLCFCAVEQLGFYAEAAGDCYIRGGMAPKKDPKPQFSGDRPAQGGDGIAIMHSRDRDDSGRLIELCRWNGGGHAALWHWYTERKDRHHETQKPIELMITLVEQFTDPGDLVWDPYAGSATTGVACLLTGRRFIGHEMQPHYFDVAVERLRAAGRGTTLEAARAGQMTLTDVLEVER